MKKFLFLCLVVLFSNCREKKVKTINHLEGLVGKWKVSQAGNDFIIHISADSIFQQYSYESKADLKQKIVMIDAQNIALIPLEKFHSKINTNHQEIKSLVSEYSFTTVYNFQKKEGQLVLLNQSTKEENIAIKCNTDICDEQKDFFRKVDVKIDLPFVGTQKTSLKAIADTDINVYIGKAKKPQSILDQNISKLWVNNKFIEFKNLPFAIDAAFSRLPDDVTSPSVVAYLDKSTNNGAIQELTSQFSKYGLKKVYFGVKKSKDSLGLVEFKIEETGDQAEELFLNPPIK